MELSSTPSSSPAEAARLNFLHLKTQQVQLLRVGFFVHDQRGFFGFECGAAADQFAECRAFLFQAAEGVEDGELPGGMQQRLMVVRAVHVHQPFADGGQHVQRGGRAVDELAVRAVGRERALEDKLVFLARFQAVLNSRDFFFLTWRRPRDFKFAP